MDKGDVGDNLRGEFESDGESDEGYNPVHDGEVLIAC